MGDYAFSNCQSLKSISIPTSLNIIGTGVFSETKWLSEQDQPVIICDTLVSYTNAAGDVTISDNVTKIDALAFCRNNDITSITLPASIKEIGHGAFAYCRNLNSVVALGEFDAIHYDAFFATEWINSQEGAVVLNNVLLKYDDASGDVILPDGITYISENVFKENEDITSIVIPEGVTEIHSDDFYKCESLKSIIIPGTVKEIDEYAFAYCESLENVVLNEGLETIGMNAFYDCSHLDNIIIPDSVIEIESGAFYDCVDLLKLKVSDEFESSYEDIFNGTSWYRCYQ